MPIAEDPEPRPSEGSEPGGSDPSGAGGKDPFADLVLDEEFIKAASVKEQSGRTRMLSARWKHTPPVDPGGRRSVNDGPAPKRRFGRKPKLQVVDPWGNPRPARRRRTLEWRTPLFIVLTVAVLLAALNVDALRTWLHGGADGSSPKAYAPVPTVAPETARPTSAPSAVPTDQPTVAHPWAGSPAEGWPTSMDAFGPKDAPDAIGVFSAEQVAAQVKLVKDYLAAANLDPKVIAGARPDAALALLSRESQGRIGATLDKPSKEQDPTLWFARFDPREAIQIGDSAKVQGLISVEGDGDKGVLVHTDFTYVYALRPGPDAAKAPGSARPSTKAPQAPQDGTAKPVGLLVPADDAAGETWTTRTIVRRQQDFRFYDPARYRVDRAKLMVDKSATDIGNSACEVYDGFLHPQFDQFAAPGPDSTGPRSDPYDRSHDLPTTGGDDCGTVSRF
ncbi:hypothetical protein ACFVXG_12255 [Kitasatospora sp. NPDC058162]|uniref:SCO2583/SCO2584 N-terminal domain-containing protein n=1 Tax=Kitasatospora sp. NPDC058162 TaxID=3346362 RepID=UPI0036DF2BF6